jgi:hypothetical protein
VLLNAGICTSCSIRPWKNGCVAASACSRVTPGCRRPKTFTQRLRRLSTSSQFGVIWAFNITGTRTDATWPMSTPSNPAADTPITVNG